MLIEDTITLEKEEEEEENEDEAKEASCIISNPKPNVLQTCLLFSFDHFTLPVCRSYYYMDPINQRITVKCTT